MLLAIHHGEAKRFAATPRRISMMWHRSGVCFVCLQVLGRNSSVTELMGNERNKRIKQRAQQKAEMEFNKQCTFQPALQPSAVSGDNRFSLDVHNPQRISERIEACGGREVQARGATGAGGPTVLRWRT